MQHDACLVGGGVLHKAEKRTLTAATEDPTRLGLQVSLLGDVPDCIEYLLRAFQLAWRNENPTAQRIRCAGSRRFSLTGNVCPASDLQHRGAEIILAQKTRGKAI